MATNRIDSLDPALIRPGRIDRKIEFPLPDEKTKRRIFTIHTSKMQLQDVNLEEFIEAKDDLSGADIKAMCTEAGLLALRERRMRVTMVSFEKGNQMDETLIFNISGGYAKGQRKCALPEEGRGPGDYVFVNGRFLDEEEEDKMD